MGWYQTVDDTWGEALARVVGKVENLDEESLSRLETALFVVVLDVQNAIKAKALDNRLRKLTSSEPK